MGCEAHLQVRRRAPQMKVLAAPSIARGSPQDSLDMRRIVSDLMMREAQRLALRKDVGVVAE